MKQFSQFVESLKRLYVNGKVNEEKILNLCKNGKITEEEKEYILDAQQGV